MRYDRHPIPCPSRYSLDAYYFSSGTCDDVELAPDSFLYRRRKEAYETIIERSVKYERNNLRRSAKRRAEGRATRVTPEKRRRGTMRIRKEGSLHKAIPEVLGVEIRPNKDATTSRC